MLGNYDKIRKIQKLNEDELKHNIPLSGSWHSKYKDSAYIYIGNFPYELTEGDLVIICSQYGEVVDCRIARDKETGNSKGFGFICYEDQRSTILAVDNLNGANIVGRQIRVDHVEQYKIPKEYFELESDDDDNGGNYDKKERYKPTGPDGKGWGKFRILSEEDKEMFRKMEEEEVKRMERQREGFVYKENIKDKEEEWESKFNEIVNDKKEKIEKYLTNKHHRHKHHHKHKHKHHHHHHKHKHDE